MWRQASRSSSSVLGRQQRVLKTTVRHRALLPVRRQGQNNASASRYFGRHAQDVPAVTGSSFPLMTSLRSAVSLRRPFATVSKSSDTAATEQQQGDVLQPETVAEAGNESIETLAQTLISYSSRKEALEDGYGSEKLLKDAVKVVNHYTRQDLNGKPIPLLGQDHPLRSTLLCRQLGTMMHTLILPEFDMTFEKHQLQNVLKSSLFTLRSYARDAAHPALQVSLEDAHIAQDLLQKILSIQVGDDLVTGNNKHTLVLCLNSVLQTWAALSGTSKDIQVRRDAAQNAEHLLLSAGQQHFPSTVLGSSLMPDVASFNTVMTAWSKCAKPRKKGETDAEKAKSELEISRAAAERAQALLYLLVDLSQEHAGLEPTSISHDVVLKAWSSFVDKEAPDRALDLLNDMMDRSTTLGHAAPTKYTLTHFFNILAKAQLPNVDPYVSKVEELRERLGIQPNTILYNAALNAYTRSRPKTAKLNYQICEKMNHIVYRMEASLPGSQPDKITYQTVLQAWVNCGRRIHNEANKGDKSFLVKNCAEHAERHLQAALSANVGIDLHMINHVMAGFAAFDPLQAKRIFESFANHGLQPTLDSYGILLDSYHRATRPKQTWHAQAADDLLAEMERLGQQEEYLSPDSGCYDAVIMAWAATQTRKGALRAAAVLDKLCQSYQQQLQQAREDPSMRYKCRPYTTLFMTAITALSRYGTIEDIARVEDLIQQMEDFKTTKAKAPPTIAPKMANVEPNRITYNVLLNMHAKYSDVKSDLTAKAEALIDKMSASQDPRGQPDRFSYSALVKVYGHANVPLSRIMAMVDKIQSEQVDIDVEFFNMCFKVLADRAKKDGEAAVKARAILDIMESGVYGKAARPDSFSYASVAQAYRNIGTYESAQEAEELMNRWAATDQSKTKSKGGDGTDIVFYNTVIGAYAESNTQEGILRAQELLQQLENVRKEENRTDMPNTVTYNTVMRASSGEQAQEIYDLMISRYRRGEKSAKPNTSTFFYLLTAWVNSNAPESAEQAEAALRQKNAFHKDDLMVSANAIDYLEVLTKWGNCAAEDGPERAEALLEDMVLRYDSGLSKVAPDKFLYDRVLLNYADSSIPTAAPKAQAVLDRMVKRAQENNGPMPDRVSFSNCMYAWAKSQTAGCDAKAEELMNRALELYKNQNVKDVAPDSRMYGAIIKACAFAPIGDSISVSDPLERGIRIFSLMKESDDPELSPIHVTYAQMFRIVSRHMNQEDPRRLPLIKKLFEDCCRGGQFSQFALIEFVKATPDDLSRKVLGVDEKQDLSRLRIYNLPSEWSRNVRT